MDRASPAAQRGGFLAATALVEQDSEVLQDDEQVRMVGRQDIFHDLEGAPKRWLGLGWVECVKFCKWAVALGPAGWIMRLGGAGASSAP